MSRRRLAVAVGVALAISLGIAVFAAPWASRSPDGLERVATDQGFAATATPHPTAGGPAADYSTWAWRAAGVVLVFGLAAGLTAASSLRRREAPTGSAASPSAG